MHPRCVPIPCPVTHRSKGLTVVWVVVIGCRMPINPPVVAAETPSDIFSSSGSAVSSGSSRASSLWVLESLLGPLGLAMGRGCIAAAPVWSSERLFATNADKERGPLNYPLASTFNRSWTSAPPVSSHDYSGSGYSGVRDDIHSYLKTRPFEGLENVVCVSKLFLHFFFRKCTFCLATPTSLPVVAR